jgi:hypothetical protein
MMKKQKMQLLSAVVSRSTKIQQVSELSTVFTFFSLLLVYIFIAVNDSYGDASTNSSVVTACDDDPPLMRANLREDPPGGFVRRELHLPAAADTSSRTAPSPAATPDLYDLPYEVVQQTPHGELRRTSVCTYYHESQRPQAAHHQQTGYNLPPSTAPQLQMGYQMPHPATAPQLQMGHQLPHPVITHHQQLPMSYQYQPLAAPQQHAWEQNHTMVNAYHHPPHTDIYQQQHHQFHNNYQQSQQQAAADMDRHIINNTNIYLLSNSNCCHRFMSERQEHEILALRSFIRGARGSFFENNGGARRF